MISAPERDRVSGLASLCSRCLDLSARQLTLYGTLPAQNVVNYNELLMDSATLAPDDRANLCGYLRRNSRPLHHWQIAPLWW